MRESTWWRGSTWKVGCRKKSRFLEFMYVDVARCCFSFPYPSWWCAISPITTGTVVVLSSQIRSTCIYKSFYLLRLAFPWFFTEVLVSRGIVMSMRRQVLSFLFFSTTFCLSAAMVLSVWMGISLRMMTLSFSLTVLGSCSYDLPSSQCQTRCRLSSAFVQLPCCSGGIFSFASSGQPETRWSMVSSKRPHSLHFGSSSGFLRMLCCYQRVGRLWSWAAMIKPSVSALRPAAFSHLWVLSCSRPVSSAVGICSGAILIPTRAWAVGNPGVWHWPLFWGHRWCSHHPRQVVLQAVPVPDWTS